MSLYKREGSPFWQYSFTINGLRFRGSTRCTGKREAAKVEAEERHRAANRRTREQPWRLRECFGAYWEEHAKRTRDAKGIFRKLSHLSRLLGPDTHIADLTNADLMDYREARQEEGLQRHSVNRDFTCLMAALKHARTMHGKQIPELAWSKVRSEEPRHRIRYLTRDEYARLLDVCEWDMQRLIKFAVATGLRKNNLLKMDWSQVDLADNIVRVVLKGNKDHTVKLTPATKAALVTGVNDRTGLVFKVVNFRKRWYRALKEAEIYDFRFHDLRHTCATWMRMAGADLADICEALGHSSVTVTMRYAHIEPEHHVTAFDRISERVWSHSRSQSRKKRQKC